MYLQESDYNIGAENDLESFSQVMSCKESVLWYDAMKKEMNSIKINRVWDLVEFPNGAKAIGLNGSLRQRKTHWATLRDTQQDLLLRDSLRKKESGTQRLSLLYLRKIPCALFWH